MDRPKNYPLLVAQQGSYADILDFLAQGHDPNLRVSEVYGNPLLHVAVDAGNTAAITALVQSGADIEAPDHNGMTPLGVAAEWGSKVDVLELLRLGAKLDAQDRDGRTALDRALLGGKLGCVQALIEQGAQIDGCAISDWSHWQVVQHSRSFRLLMKLGANPANRDDEGRDALWWMAQRGRVSQCGALMAQGLDPDTTDDEGMTALMAAANQGHTSTCRCLIKAGASLGLVNAQGQDAMSLAMAEGHDQTAKNLAGAKRKALKAQVGKRAASPRTKVRGKRM